MNELEQIVALDCKYIESFSKTKRKEWGILFYNENQPKYYDANHAHIWQEVTNGKEVLQQVKSFYEEKRLIPRIYLYNVEQNQPLIDQFQRFGFQYEEYQQPVQLWDGMLSNTPINSKITVELVTNENYEEALEIECSIKEFGGLEVREKAFKHEFSHPQFTYYLLRYEGEACCTACLFKSDKQALIESAATVEVHRGKGLIGHLIRHLQEKASEQGIEKLWVLPINEKVESVYQKSGFQTVFLINSVHAFTKGKSIKEIRG